MTMIDECLYVLCAFGPLRGDGNEIAGSIEMSCEKCQKSIVVAPSGQRVVYTQALPVVYLCLDCGAAQMKGDPDAKVTRITEEQRDELAVHYEHHL